ncbi:MAG: hypothetical protein ACYDDV_00395 [Methanoregula sp.]
MARSQITKTEFESIVALCKKQDRAIQEQKELINKLLFEANVNKGWIIQSAIELHTVRVKYTLMAIDVFSADIYDNKRPDLKAVREEMIQFMRQAHDQSCTELRMMEAAWANFTATNGEAAGAIIERLDNAKVKSEGTNPW